MLSSVTLNCQVTMISLNSGSQLSEISTISHKLTSRVMCLSWCLYLSLPLVFDQFMSLRNSDQMSQRSQVSGTALWRSSLHVFVYVIVIVFVFVFVIVFFSQLMCLYNSDVKTLIVSGAQGTKGQGHLLRCCGQLKSNRSIFQLKLYSYNVTVND